jgi:hypothetical protein
MHPKSPSSSAAATVSAHCADSLPPSTLHELPWAKKMTIINPFAAPSPQPRRHLTLQVSQPVLRCGREESDKSLFWHPVLSAPRSGCSSHRLTRLRRSPSQSSVSCSSSLACTTRATCLPLGRLRAFGGPRSAVYTQERHLDAGQISERTRKRQISYPTPEGHPRGCDFSLVGFSPLLRALDPAVVRRPSCLLPLSASVPNGGPAKR